MASNRSNPTLGRRLVEHAAPLTALLMLALVGMDTLDHPTPADTDPYHRTVRQAADRVPIRIGPWVGSESSLPPAAVALYRPNVLFNRRYENVATGEACNVLFVHCRDIRDMAGHYPPICYPANGWRAQRREPLAVRLQNLTIHGAEYEFSSMRFNRASSVVVYNFMVTRHGRTHPDMGANYRAAGRETQRYYGAAQMQIVLEASMAPERRREVYAELLTGYEPVIQAVRAPRESIGGDR